MSKYLVGLFALLLPLASMAGEALKGWPLTGFSEKEPQVIMAYESQCAAWEKKLQNTDPAKAGFQAKCVSQMKNIWPVGADDSSSGE